MELDHYDFIRSVRIPTFGIYISRTERRDLGNKVVSRDVNDMNRLHKKHSYDIMKDINHRG